MTLHTKSFFSVWSINSIQQCIVCTINSKQRIMKLRKIIFFLIFGFTYFQPGIRPLRDQWPNGRTIHSTIILKRVKKTQTSPVSLNNAVQKVASYFQMFSFNRKTDINRPFTRKLFDIARFVKYNQKDIDEWKRRHFSHCTTYLSKITSLRNLTLYHNDCNQKVIRQKTITSSFLRWRRKTTGMSQATMNFS